MKRQINEGNLGFQEFELPSRPVIPKFEVNIEDFGGVSDGKTLNTEAFASAIVECVKQGGGRVYVSAGKWLTGAIHLASHVELHLAKGAEVNFSQNPDDYLPVVYMQRGGVFCYNYSPFIYAYKCHDIAITGEGVFNGQGESWWPWKHAQPGMEALFNAGTTRLPVDQRVYGTKEDGVRPPFFQTVECTTVLIEGVAFYNSPSWTIHPVLCDNLTIRHITVKSPVSAYNTDGIDPDSCTNVLVEHCHVDTGDDGICLKAGRDEEGWDLGVPCENVLIRHCYVRAAHGGFVIGSEMSAGIRNVLVHDCVFEGTDRGIRIKTRPGRGGFMENIQAERITMRNIAKEAVIITLFYPTYVEEQIASTDYAVPEIRNIYIKDINCEMADTAVLLAGMTGYYLRNMTLENLNIKANKGIVFDNVIGLEMSNINIHAVTQA